MPVAIPLIRGFALLPTLFWLADRGDSVERALAEVDLSMSPITDPFRPIPLVHAASLLRNAALKYGPDTPCKIVSGTGSLEIAMLGKVALGVHNPLEALKRIVAALPYYCSHERVSFEISPGTYVVREYFAHKFAPETRHLLLQYAAAMIDRILGATGETGPRFASLEMPPHPKCGVEHLRPWFGDRVAATHGRGFVAAIPNPVMERAFDKLSRDRLKGRAIEGEMPALLGGSLSESVRTLLSLMIESAQASTMKRVVAAAGTSTRSFQRRLEAEGTSFSELLADVRRDETLEMMKKQDITIAAIAADLGYSDQATFTRAFRRWTGSPPGRFRDRRSP